MSNVSATTVTASELQCNPASDRPNAPSESAFVYEQKTRLIRRLILLYIALWLLEGGLRRWFLPGLASPLLLIRDPLVVVIYYLAFSFGLFPMNGFTIWGVLLALLSFINAMLLGHGNLLVALYGVRCDFLHVPLIFVMAGVLRQNDVIALAKIAVWVSIPYTALLVTQFYEPQAAWVNRGVGGDTDGAGFSGALDHYRPPGTFSFITGPSELYPLLTACWFALLLMRKLSVGIMIASGAAILLAIPVSISRTLFLSVAIVAIAGVGAMFVGGRFSVKLVTQFVLVAVLLTFLAGLSPIFQDGMETFNARWETATTDGGGFQVAIVDRVMNDLAGAFRATDDSVGGTGFSTNVGQKLLTQNVGFGGAEGEWGRLLYDNGLILGSLLVGYRIALAGSIIFASIRAWRRRSVYGLIFAAAAFMLLLNGQWGQASTLGAAVIAGGLALASSYQGAGHSKKCADTLSANSR